MERMLSRSIVAVNAADINDDFWQLGHIACQRLPIARFGDAWAAKEGRSQQKSDDPAEHPRSLHGASPLVNAAILKDARRRSKF